MKEIRYINLKTNVDLEKHCIAIAKTKQLEKKLMIRKSIQLANKVCSDFNCNDRIIRNGMVALYTSMISFLEYEVHQDDRNYISFTKMLNNSEIRINDDYFQSPMDLMFLDLDKEYPECFTVVYYNMFKRLPNKYKAKIIFMSSYYFNNMLISKKVKE